ncbi:MAG: hypothetical protein OXJ62_14825 [Spirochaetaceae bacterium]|nr:hypothetical protein [Spirochaetaceae bacterium]
MPDLNSFVVTLAVMLVPGYLGAQVYRSLGRSARDRAMMSWGDFLQVLVFALVGLFPGLMLSGIFGWWQPPALLTMSGDALASPHWLFDLVVPSCFAALVGMVAAAISNRKLLYRLIARPLGIQRNGHEDVWTYLMNSKELDWIFLRDHRFGLVYKGWIELYSDSGSSRELTLKDVDVFDNASGRHLYEVSRLYVARDQHEVSVEIAATEPEEADGREERRNPSP